MCPAFSVLRHAPARQQQLSHAKLATTEAHYLQRQTRGPDVRAVLDKYAGGSPTFQSHPALPSWTYGGLLRFPH
jgi:hypothetical protein